MTAELIKKINSLCPENQGVFIQPSMIPVSIKTAVIYTRYKTGEYSGGTYCEDSEVTYSSENEPENKWDVLEIGKEL